MFVKIRLILTVIFFAVPAMGFAQNASERTTQQGYTYWHFPIEGAKRTAISINWPSGLSELPVGQEVAARIGINLMLNGGAGGKPPEDIIAEFEDLDAGSRLFVQPDAIRGFIVTPDESANEAAQIANDVLVSPNLDQKWFDRERERYAGEGKASDSNIWGTTWNLVRRAILNGHPNERFWSLQPAANTEAVSLETIREWHEQAFGTNGLTITVAGLSDFDRIEKAIDRALSGLPKVTPPRVQPFNQLKVPNKTVVFHAPWADKSTMLIIGELPNSKAGKDLELNIATGVLGYGEQSRLFKAIRSELRATYGFRAGMEAFTRKHRILNMGGEVETEKLQEALDAAKATYEEFRTDGVGIIEFPFARRFYGQRIDDEMEKPESVAYMLMESRLDGRAADDIGTMRERIGNLERGAVNTFIAETYPPFDTMLKIIVTPKADAIADACVITSYDEFSKC